MDTATLTFEQIEAEVRRLAAEKPDYIYPINADGGRIPVGTLYPTQTDEDRTVPCPRCIYTQRGDKPPCIWGQALLNLGVPADVLHNEFTNIRHLLTDVLHVDAADAQLRWAGRVQIYQDGGTSSWSQAVSQADRDAVVKFRN